MRSIYVSYLFGGSFHQLELVIRESVSKALLNDIKECLIKLYYLYNKSKKSKKPKDELDCFVDVTDDLPEEDGGAPIRVCGTRQIWHFVKVLRSAINRLGIYLTNLENFGKKGKNGNIKADIFGCISRWQDYNTYLE